MEIKNRKGIIFMLDVLFAISIVVLILTSAYFLSRTNYSEGMETIAAKRIASDIVATMDYNDTLDTLNQATIQNTLNDVLPNYLNMSMMIYVYDPDINLIDQIEINSQLDNSYYEGRWLSLLTNSTGIEKLIEVDYKIGFK